MACGVQVEAKPFQLGVRIEHPQQLVTRGRYGEGQELRRSLASYNLQSKAVPPGSTRSACVRGAYRGERQRGGRLCTNGMSNSKHSSRWANAAVTTFTPEDFEAHGFHGPLAGVALQRALEERFFVAGGSTYAAPRSAPGISSRDASRPAISRRATASAPSRVGSISSCQPVFARPSRARSFASNAPSLDSAVMRGCWSVSRPAVRGRFAWSVIARHGSRLDGRTCCLRARAPAMPAGS